MKRRRPNIAVLALGVVALAMLLTNLWLLLQLQFYQAGLKAVSDLAMSLARKLSTAQSGGPSRTPCPAWAWPSVG